MVFVLKECNKKDNYDKSITLQALHVMKRIIKIVVNSAIAVTLIIHFNY